MENTTNSVVSRPSESDWADYAAVQALCGNLSGNKLTCNSSENTRSQSSQLAKPLWTDSGLKSGITVCTLISTKKKKVQVGNELSNIPPKSSHAREKPSQHITVTCSHITHTNSFTLTGTQ